VHAEERERSDARADARFAALYRDEFTRLARLADVILDDRGAAEEIVQEVFADVLRRWPSVEGQPWLPDFLRRSVIGHCRDFAKGRSPSIADVDQVAGEGRDETADGYLAWSARTEVRRALARLPLRQRECVAARYLLEMGDAETARLLGISVGSVNTHVRRGMHTLEKLLREERT